MARWLVYCSICDKAFEREQVMAPYGEVAENHGQKDLPMVPCIGSGQVMFKVERAE